MPVSPGTGCQACRPVLASTGRIQSRSSPPPPTPLRARSAPSAGKGHTPWRRRARRPGTCRRDGTRCAPLVTADPRRRWQPVAPTRLRACLLLAPSLYRTCPHCLERRDRRASDALLFPLPASKQATRSEVSAAPTITAAKSSACELAGFRPLHLYFPHFQRLIPSRRTPHDARVLKQCHMNISPRRLAASRANAARSTGPRTAEGKSRSARNARKHGLATVERIADAPRSRTLHRRAKPSHPGRGRYPGPRLLPRRRFRSPLPKVRFLQALPQLSGATRAQLPPRRRGVRPPQVPPQLRAERTHRPGGPQLTANRQQPKAAFL